MIYTDDIGDTICERLAEGQSLLSICKDIGIGESTVRYWVASGKEPFSANYARAREVGDDCKFDRLSDMAAEEPPKVKGFTDSGWVQWKNNQLVQERWNLARSRPKKYGDKLAVEHSADESLANRLREARAQRAK